MPLFDQQRIDDPAKWRSHYAFGGAVLLGFGLEAPGQLSVALRARKSGAHPGLASLPEAARALLPAGAFLVNLRVSCAGVRGLSWLGRPAAMSAQKEAGGILGAVETFEVTRATAAERDLWSAAPAPFSPDAAPVQLWRGVLAGRDFAMQWFCEAASLREGA
ncbi:MAG: hypothetical protein IT452_16985 [Planctomycetia bacterium]|nr:hypothetical protein [Planctomycetia bacterium]